MKIINDTENILLLMIGSLFLVDPYPLSTKLQNVSKYIFFASFLLSFFVLLQLEAEITFFFFQQLNLHIPSFLVIYLFLVLKRPIVGLSEKRATFVEALV